MNFMNLTIRDPGSAITHFIGMLLATLASIPLLIKAASSGGSAPVIAMTIFMTSMILLYAASTLYHTVNLTGSALKRFKKLDHMMIFVLIAGSYTPVCMLVLPPPTGHILLAVVWGLAAVGILLKALWVTCPKWFSSIIYIAMGWTCVSVFGQLFSLLTLSQFLWLLAGGIVYTIGGVIYALKLPLFNSRHRYFGSHEIFHLFVMGGSICHFICMYQLL